MIPAYVSKNLKRLLTNSKDLKKVAEMFGYGRCVTPSGKVISLLWQEGGELKSEEKNWYIRILYDAEGN